MRIYWKILQYTGCPISIDRSLDHFWITEKPRTLFWNDPAVKNQIKLPSFWVSSTMGYCSWKLGILFSHKSQYPTFGLFFFLTWTIFGSAMEYWRAKKKKSPRLGIGICSPIKAAEFPRATAHTKLLPASSCKIHPTWLKKEKSLKLQRDVNHKPRPFDTRRQL